MKPYKTVPHQNWDRTQCSAHIPDTSEGLGNVLKKNDLV